MIPRFSILARRWRACVVAGLAVATAGCQDTPEEVLLDPSDITPLPVLDQPVAIGVPTWIPIPTYDGSGEVTEPDIVRFPAPWHGWEYWMAISPYANSNDLLENPSIVVSHDGLNWVVPDGLTNPVVGLPQTGKAHNSDPDLLYSPVSGRLVLVYREVNSGRNYIKRLTSGDGVNWGPIAQVLDAPNHQLISPTVVVRDGHQPVMWVVDAGIGCASLATRVVARRWRGSPDMENVPDGSAWSKPFVTNLQQPGFIIWHIDVLYVASRKAFWAIYPARRAGTKDCGKNNQLFVARSRDGVHWVTFDKPVLSTGVTPWANSTLYRSTMLFDPATQMFRVWLSAQSDGGPWYIGYVDVPLPSER